MALLDDIGGRISLVHERERFVIAGFDADDEFAEARFANSAGSSSLFIATSITRAKQPMLLDCGKRSCISPAISRSRRSLRAKGFALARKMRFTSTSSSQESRSAVLCSRS